MSSASDPRARPRSPPMFNGKYTNKKDTIFAENMKLLKDFQQEYGHYSVTRNYYKNNPDKVGAKQLFNFVTSKRYDYIRKLEGRKPRSLTDYHIFKLNEVNFNWTTYQSQISKSMVWIWTHHREFKRLNNGSLQFDRKDAKHPEIFMLRKSFLTLVSENEKKKIKEDRLAHLAKMGVKLIRYDNTSSNEQQNVAAATSVLRSTSLNNPDDGCDKEKN